MQYSWVIAIILVLLIGSGAAGIAIGCKGMKSPLGAMIQFGTAIAIVGVFLHNMYWEREINQMASKGWTLIYTFPAFLICLVISGGLAIGFFVRSRRIQAVGESALTTARSEVAAHGEAGQRATAMGSKSEGNEKPKSKGEGRSR